jgi:hypothetical protein
LVEHSIRVARDFTGEQAHADAFDREASHVRVEVGEVHLQRQRVERETEVVGERDDIGYPTHSIGSVGRQVLGSGNLTRRQHPHR